MKVCSNVTKPHMAHKFSNKIEKKVNLHKSGCFKKKNSKFLHVQVYMLDNYSNFRFKIQLI